MLAAAALEFLGGRAAEADKQPDGGDDEDDAEGDAAEQARVAVVEEGREVL